MLDPPSDPPLLRVLVVGDLEAARGLYRDLLGLAVLRDGEWGLILGAGTPLAPALTLCPAASLSNGARDLVRALLAAQGGAWVQLATADLNATLERLRAYGARILELGSDRPDGARDGAALDPWGNTLRLVERAHAPP